MNWQYLPAHHTAKSVGRADTQPVDLVALNRMLVASGGQPVQPSWVSSSGGYGAPEPRPVPQLLAPVPPPAPRRRRRWPVAVALAAVVAVLGGMAAAVATSPAMARSISAIVDPSPAPGPAAVPAASQPAAPHVVEITKRVIFRVTGSAPDGVSVRSYGTQAAYLIGGDYLPLPWHASMPYSADASWYAINAQLDDGIGDITTEVIFRKITRYSDGSRKVADRVAATGHVADGYGIASAQWNR
jgi:serine/threonine-protein kinase